MPAAITDSNSAEKSADTKAKDEIVPPSVALLGELSESSRNLPNSSSDLGTILLGLTEISKRAYELRKGLPVDNNTKAHYLLAGSGVNAENIQSELQSIRFYQNQEPSDIATFESEAAAKYLREEKEESILAAIGDSIVTAALDFDAQATKNISMDWTTRKNQILVSYGLSRPSENSAGNVPRHTTAAWTKSQLGRAVLGPISGSGEFTDVEFIPPSSQVLAPTISSNSNQGAVFNYTGVIQELNYARQNGASFPVCHAFHEVSQELATDLRSLQMQDIWKIILEIAGPIAKEREFASAYFNAAPNSAEAVGLRTRIVEGGKRFLENQYYEHIESRIAQQPMTALGGAPSAFNKFRAALKLEYYENNRWRLPSMEIVNDIPIWALIYNLVRAGCLEDALAFTQSSSDIFHKLGTSFPTYLKAYVESPQRVLPANLLANIRKEFEEQVRFFDETTSDPFKYALYKIVGRCEVNKKAFPGVISTTEDWLWAHLSLIYEDTATNSVHEKYTLQNLQATVTEFGAKFFNPDRKTPALYCQVLMMSGLFEKAVHYAYGFSQSDAVNFSIALTYYGLLRPITNVLQLQSELLYVNKLEQSEINFARLMGFYTREFRRSDPVYAAEYITLISLNSDLKEGKEHLKLCQEALKELVLETREFSQLLGDIRHDGSRNPGAIERLMDLIGIADIDAYLRDITQQAAVKSEEDGRIADAVLLYQLAQDCDTVISIINKSLGEMLSVTPLGQAVTSYTEGAPVAISSTDDPAQLAQHVMDVYNNNPDLLQKVKPANLETCNTLLKIVNARDAFARGDAEQCLQDIDDTGILMLDPNADVGMVRNSAQQSHNLQHPIARNISSLLVMAMRCCYEIVEQINTNTNVFHYDSKRHQAVSPFFSSFFFLFSFN